MGRNKEGSSGQICLRTIQDRFQHRVPELINVRVPSGVIKDSKVANWRIPSNSPFTSMTFPARNLHIWGDFSIFSH
jgi:hypothetical protein